MLSSIKSVFEQTRNNKFTWEQDWERGWNAQPKPGRFYFVGTSPDCKVQFNPRTRTLIVWNALDAQDRWERKIGNSTALKLTNLVSRKVS